MFNIKLIRNKQRASHINAIISKQGEGVLYDKEVLSQQNFSQHGEISIYTHCVNVAFLSLALSELMHIRVDQKSLVRGALLHDFFLYDWHDHTRCKSWHAFRHPREAFENASRDFELNKIEKDIILKHMFPLVPFFPRYRESWIVSLADKICAVCETAKVSVY